MPSARTPPALPGRRTVLQAGLAGSAALAILGTSGCRLRVGSPNDRADDGRSPSPSPDTGQGPDDLALGRAVDRATLLGRLYSQAVLARPDLAGPLQALAADHAAHLRALTALAPSPVVPGESASDPSGSPTTGTLAPLAPIAVLSTLGQAERTAVSAALADVQITDSTLAALLASIAACSSSHLTLLARLPAPRAGGAKTAQGHA